MSIQYQSGAQGQSLVRWLLRCGVLLLMFYFCLVPAQAGSIRCGTYLVTDGNLPGTSMVEVARKCGEPYAKYGDQWIYMKGSTVYRVYFNTKAEVRRIQAEIVR